MRMKALSKALALAGLALALPVLSANTATITVTATVSGKCNVTGSDTITFTIDPTSGSASVGTGSATAIVYNCTNKYTPSVTFKSANSNSTASWYLKSAGTTTDTVNYTPSLVGGVLAGKGFGSGSDNYAQVQVSVAVTDAQGAPYHADYGDTITMTIQ